MRKVLRTRSWSLPSCCTSGSADSREDTGPIAMMVEVRISLALQGGFLLSAAPGTIFITSCSGCDYGYIERCPDPVTEAFITRKGNVYNWAADGFIFAASAFVCSFPYFRQIDFCLQYSGQYSIMAPSIAPDQVLPSKPGIIATPLPNPSLQVTADHQLKQVDAPVHAPKKGEVLLQVKATGICGYAAIAGPFLDTMLTTKVRHPLLESRTNPYAGLRGRLHYRS